MNTWGDVLLATVATAVDEVRLVAPFIKANVLSRILDRIQDSATVTIYTRWRPDEVAAGVTDLEVLDAVRSRPRTTLQLCHTLHAKYYRADGRVLVGSANLTAAALGWAPQSNFEILIETEWPTATFATFERSLSAASVAATNDVRQRVAAAAELLDAPRGSEEPSFTPGASYFVPRTRNPELLFSAYSGAVDNFSTAAREQTEADLRVLGIPFGLNETQFKRVVGALLLQAPVVSAVDQFATTSRRFGEGRSFMAELLAQSGSDRDAAEAWQTLTRWLVYYLPDRYQLTVARYSEIFSKLPKEA